MKRRLPISLILFFIFKTVFSQTAPSADIATIKQNLKKMNVLGSVLYIAAHPDDENTRLLAYLAQEKHYRTGYLSLTRGDGGQNLIGTEQSELLGLIRTQELLAARRTDGAEQFFTRANDFGFSKGPDETLKIWDKDKVLGDMVWVIRKFRPDVMICRFPTTGEGGHGHHTSSAILAQEAFSAAADPKRYPEQLKYVQTWQAKRLLWNTFSFGRINTTSPDQFKINVGGYNPILGKSYGEIAADSRSNHKTQGFGSAKQRGDAFEYFKTILGDAPKIDLMDGVKTTWDRVKGGDEIAAQLKIITNNFDDDAPENSVKPLITLLGNIEKIPDTYWREQKSIAVKELIAACSGLWFEAYTAEPAYAVGDSADVQLQIINRSSVNAAIKSISSSADKRFKTLNEDLPNNQLKTVNFKIKTEKISQPYWLESPHGIGSYTINDDMKVGNPENPDALSVLFEFVVDGKVINISRKLVYKYVDPARGEIYQPLEITPPVTANIADKVYIFNSTQPQNIKVKLRSFTDAAGDISIKPLNGWKITPEKINFTGKKKGDEWTVNFTVEPTNSKSNTSVFEVVTKANGQSFSKGIQHINYEHIPNITLFPPAQAKLVNIDLKIAGKKIGYIQGAGDLIPEALKQVGYDVHDLTENEILNSDLSEYDAIVTGVRAYNVNERLVYEQPKLLQYVKNGGNLVIQYNKNTDLVTNNIGPYPLRVVNERVTDENAEVTILDKQNPIFNYPNHISQDDFKGWIQERSIYMPQTTDPHYLLLLQMNDAGQTPQKGSLIISHYGTGRYIYTSLVFFRELPEGVPGVYRLFINLLSKPKNSN
ncbi:PIG-L family deacetylase [Mucilaginibacter segetis]|uniref:PIG-L family deacetylase n=1 Tax=Mucilaginibacter segetis TaxID=2793071 RepID=A0A934PW02_9SPHI|nr:PIG-L family deacetylase [Mucilaginibacter segetis]MBK0380150.1 PIG-L family deacetylase [Mucilaginibacter segetis]